MDRSHVLIPTQQRQQGTVQACPSSRLYASCLVQLKQLQWQSKKSPIPNDVPSLKLLPTAEMKHVETPYLNARYHYSFPLHQEQEAWARRSSADKLLLYS